MTRREKLAQIEAEIAKQNEEWGRIEVEMANLGEDALPVDASTLEALDATRATTGNEQPHAGLWAVRA